MRDHRPARMRQCQSGFTLIEVIVALTLLSLMSVIILESYRAGLGIWERQYHDVRSLDSARVLMQKFREQVRSSYPWKINKKRGKAELYFAGEEDSIQMATMAGMSSQRANGIIHAVRYALEDSGGEKQLLVEEYSWPRKSFPDGEEPLVSETLAGIVDFKLEYGIRKRARTGRQTATEEETEEMEWVSSWPGEDRENLGKVLSAVSVSLKVKSAGDSVEEFSAVIPVMKKW